MRRVVVMVLALTLSAGLVVGTGALAKPRSSKGKLVSSVKKRKAKAPKRWRQAGGWTVQPIAIGGQPASETADDPGAAPTPTPTPAPGGPIVPPPLPPSDPGSVSVGATEFAFQLSQSTVSAGEVRVQFDNSRAEDPHQLVLSRGSELFDFGEQAPGSVTQRTFTLSKGEYQLLCPILDHVQRGMKATLTVR